MNFPYNLLTSCTSIEQVNLPPSHIGKIHYINTETVTILTHILCLSLESWVADRWKRSVDFLWTFLIIFSQLALLLRRSTYVTVTLKNILYQHRYSDNPNTHIMCLSWIMGDGQVEYIYWLLINFPDNLLTSCTSIGKVNLPYSHIGRIYYINTGIVMISNTHIMCLLLNHGWRTDRKYILTSYELSW
jgi:hypothetical protein